MGEVVESAAHRFFLRGACGLCEEKLYSAHAAQKDDAEKEFLRLAPPFLDEKKRRQKIRRTTFSTGFPDLSPTTQRGSTPLETPLAYRKRSVGVDGEKRSFSLRPVDFAEGNDTGMSVVCGQIGKKYFKIKKG